MKTKIETVKAELNTGDVATYVKAVEKSLAELRADIEGTPAKLEDDDDYQVACELLVRVVNKRKELDGKRDAFEEAAKTMLAIAASLFKESYTNVDACEMPLRDRVEEYAKALEDKAYKLRVKAAALPPDKAKAIEKLLLQAEDFAAPKVGGISFQKGNDVEVFDPAKIPDEFTTRTVNKKALLAALESGRIVPGARFIPGKTVRVSPKNAEVA